VNLIAPYSQYAGMKKVQDNFASEIAGFTKFDTESKKHSID